MKRLPDRYYDLVLERDQLKEELEYIKTAIDDLNKEIEAIENEIDDKPKKFYVITREVCVTENDDFYSFVNEYSSIAEALVEFTMQKNELKEAFVEYVEMSEKEDYFYVRDNDESVELALHEVYVEQ
jgi:predicted  nucleic acid-binding Zn-ribbon protein